ncbi:hypothetical protein EN45_046400 [Penicillium chrysogenum]|jgi:hypothetical protein|uniref:Pc15g01620 protein n=2 Tax=Penicillium chrysogenum species complex TaxID=254878 RepID=B6H6A0_PENRW|nr:uncharacterized protein N7525_009113 [Penicillium rubens]KAJ5047791.1 hypothetical protein NUH16_006287 [Penicillium rubens]KAJ5830860.1 hypothetical protein N7525_009113 [Penicillium rubens]KZN94443.1 hypothetical protein EN45_046400 [Penicillium chrysogenum]CAP83048.1 Pc15g01620 [Penicillium rubens Wisconsin 54-1255]
MADNNSPDYKALFLQAEKRRKEAEEQQRQAEERQKQAEDEGRREKRRREQEEERRKQAEDEGRQEKERREQLQKLSRPTTFVEFLRHSHDLLSRPLRVETPSRSTTGKIPLPTGKYCPTRLEHWTDCSALQSELFRSVYNYLQLTPGGAPRLFSSLHELEGLGRRLGRKPISSEQELEAYERFAVEEHINDIITELCKIPAARDELGLGDGIQFSNHTNSLNDNGAIEADTTQPSSVYHPRPDQFCIHRVDRNTTTLLTSVEYKPPHKLSVATLRMGLRPMDLWKDMVRSNKIPTNQEAKLRYNAERLVCSALVQEYHVMIQEGLEYSYVTNGIARVLLRVRQNDPGTLYYFLCDPNSEVNMEMEATFANSSVARTLCLCLMAFHSPVRGQEWRNSVRSDIPIWKTSFDHTRSHIPEDEFPQLPLNSDSTAPEFPSPDSGSTYEPSSSPPDSPESTARQVSTRSRVSCAPSDVRHRSQSSQSPDPDSKPATRHKRTFSQVPSSPSAQRVARQRDTYNDKGPESQSRHREAQFCTQRCLLGLQSGGVLDDCCPNVMRHRRNKDDLHHPITSEDLVRLLKAQLDENIDRCTPLGGCGAYGAPFKLTCVVYGYTVIGKGTTSGLWKDVSREAQVYQILRKAQGSAVPVFLGTIDLAKIYFLHGAGEIRHMLVMGWGGESTTSMELTPTLLQEIHKSNREIKALGIIHEDLRRDNILWNEELGRALIIDFHRSTLKSRPTLQRPRAVKRRLCQPEIGDPKRLRVT